MTHIESADMALMEFGGNDCDFHWDEIADNPEAEHVPNTVMDSFLQNYTNLINLVQKAGTMPLVLNLPPIGAQRYFDRFSRDMDGQQKANIIKWLGGDVEYIHRWHKSYNDRLCALISSLNIPAADIRSGFYGSSDYNDYLCLDGIHPNEAGQELIYKKLKSLIPQAAGV
jgi:lysophospholipase L1-like esterase